MEENRANWDQLASWFVNNALYSKNVVWLIQVVFWFDCYYCRIILSLSLMPGLVISHWVSEVTHRGLDNIEYVHFWLSQNV